MTALDLLQQLHEVDVMLTPYPDGTLRYKAPKGILTPALLDALRQHKAELVDVLEELGERSALAEYCGRLPRDEAERLAWECLAGKEVSCPSRSTLLIAGSWTC